MNTHFDPLRLPDDDVVRIAEKREVFEAVAVTLVIVVIFLAWAWTFDLIPERGHHGGHGGALRDGTTINGVAAESDGRVLRVRDTSDGTAATSPFSKRQGGATR